MICHHYATCFVFSVDTLNSHIQGVKHVKKKISMEAKNDQLRNQGLAPETKVVRQVSQRHLIYRYRYTYRYNTYKIEYVKECKLLIFFRFRIRCHFRRKFQFGYKKN